MNSTSAQTLYDFAVNSSDGTSLKLEQYKGKVLLIVNTASECGFSPQLHDLQSLYQTYQSQGFEVLAFPCNDFGGQEPMDNHAIGQYCSTKFHSTFTVFEKIKVKGRDMHPLYQYLTQYKIQGKLNISPKWNFHKYLVDKHGVVRDYFFSTYNPNGRKIKRAIDKLLIEP